MRIRLRETTQQFHLTATTGGRDGGSLTEGETLTGISLEANTFTIQSIYIPNDVIEFTVLVEVQGDVFVEVQDITGQSILCPPGAPCRINAQGDSVYFIRIFANEAITDTSLLVDW